MAPAPTVLGGHVFQQPMPTQSGGHGTQRRFADAAGIPIEELVTGPKKTGNAKK